jgi:hypothetical protein
MSLESIGVCAARNDKKRVDKRESRRTLMEVKESRMTLSSARQLLRPSRSFSCTVIDGQSVLDCPLLPPRAARDKDTVRKRNLPRGPLAEARMQPISSTASGEEKEMVCERTSSVSISLS